MTGRSKKDKHDRRRNHQRIQRDRKTTALSEAEHAARSIGANGAPLKKQRTGKPYTDALRREMADRGYLPDGNGGWKRVAGLDTGKTVPVKQAA